MYNKQHGSPDWHSESATRRMTKQASSAGSGAVMEAMQELITTVKLSELSKSAQAEIKNMTMVTGPNGNRDFPVWKIMRESSKIIQFIMGNQAAINRALTNRADSFSQSLQKIDYVETFNEMLATARSSGDASRAEDMLEDVVDRGDDELNRFFQQSYIIKREGDDYLISWVPGSSDFKASLFESRNNFMTRRMGAERVEQYIASGSLPNANDCESASAYFINRINSTFGTNIENLKKRQIFQVPLDFDFGVLFSPQAMDTSELDSMRKAISPEYTSKFGSRWGLNVSLRMLESQSKLNLVSNTARMVLVEVLIMPYIKVSAEAMRYLTQSKDVADIKLATVRAWAEEWTYDIFWGSNRTPVTFSSLSDNFDFSKRKEEAIGVKPLDTRADDRTGLFIDIEGRLNYAPATSDISRDTVTAYEQILSELVEESARLEEPIDFSTDFDDNWLRKLVDPAKLIELKDKLSTFKTIPIISNWDIDISGAIDIESPTSIQEVNISGGAVPSNISMHENLSMRAVDGVRFFLSRRIEDGRGRRTPNDMEIDIQNPANITKIDAARHSALVYGFLESKGLVHTVQGYIKQAMLTLHGKSALDPDDLEYGLYSKATSHLASYHRRAVNADLTAFGAGAQPQHEAENYRSIQMDQLVAGVSRTFGGADYEDFAVGYADFCLLRDLYFSIPRISADRSLVGAWAEFNWVSRGNNLADFKFHESYYYLDVYESSLAEYATVVNRYVIGLAFSLLCADMLEVIRKKGNPLLNYDESVKYPIFEGKNLLPSFFDICEGVMPYLATFGVIMPNHEEYRVLAENEQKTFVIDPDKEVPPIPGTDGFSVFQHQYKSLQLLSNEPPVALLDIDPGGGKTITGLIDCAMLLNKGSIRRPLILAPLDLIKNWIEDLNSTLTKDQFNCVPITSATVAKWGEEALKDLILNSPPNTIFYSDSGSGPFVANYRRKVDVQFLSVRKSIYANLEWMKQFEFDYILIDESHYLKNAKGRSGGSARSRLIAELTLQPSVKFLRLASGTIIDKDIDDIIGQARLFNPAIFRTVEDFTAIYADENGDWRPDAADRIRTRLSKYCGIARAKRKDWAYALPIMNEEHPSKWIVQMTPEFKEVYDHICKDTLREIEEDSDLSKILLGDDEEAFDSLVESDDDSVDTIHLSRLEQFLLCPEQDPLNGYNGWDFAKLETPKMPKLIELLDKHFDGGDTGKVIVFVRHKSAVDGIMARLPAKYLSMTVPYNGSNVELKANLNKFRFDDSVRIIVGVEMSMNTGENLQIASRVIRLELPWSPGGVDQAIARIFRPDTKSGNPRQSIHSDWILVDDSLDIPKMGRLISRTIRKVQFDEFGSSNTAYRALPPLNGIGMNLKRFMNPEESIRLYEHISGYFEAYHTLSQIRNEEFMYERSKYLDEDGNMTVNPFVGLEGTEMMRGSRRLTFTPNVPNQNFTSDEFEDDLIPFTSWISRNKDFIENFDDFPVVMVKTEFGYGVIDRGFRGGQYRSTGSLTVLLACESGLTVNMPVDSIYVANALVGAKLSVANTRKYLGANNDKTAKYKKYIGLNARDENGMIYYDGDRPKVYDLETALVEDGLSEADAKLFAEQRAEGTRAVVDISINKAEAEAARLAAEKAKEDEEHVGKIGLIPSKTGDEEDGKLRASAAVIQGHTFLIVNGDDPDAAKLPKFQKVKPFLGIKVSNLRELKLVLEKIESLSVTTKDGKRNIRIVGRDKFDALIKRFNAKGKLAKTGRYMPEDIEFLTKRHTPPKNQLNLKLGYLVEDDDLYLVFNIAAYPALSRAFRGKGVNGVKGKFLEYRNARVKPYTSTQNALKDLSEINKVVKIVNYTQIVDLLKSFKR